MNDDELIRLAAALPPLPQPLQPPTARSLRARKRELFRNYRKFRAIGIAFLGAYVLWVSLASVPQLAQIPLFTERCTTLMTNFVQTILPLIAGSLLLRRARAIRWHSSGARSSCAFGLGCLSWAAGQAAWTWHEIMKPGVNAPFPSSGDAGFLLAVVLFLIGLLTMPSGPAVTAGCVRQVLDGLVLAVSLFGVTWQFVLSKVVADADSLGSALAIAYPVGDVLLASIVLASVANRRHRAAPTFPLVAGAVIALGCSDFAFVYQWSKQDFVAASYFDLGWIACFILLTLAAVHPQHSAPDPNESLRRSNASSLHGVSSYLISATALAMIAAQVIAASAVDTASVVTGAVIFALIMPRYVAASVEAERLLRLAYDALDSKSDIDAIQSFAGLIMLRDALGVSLTNQPCDSGATDDFLVAVERMRRRQEEGDRRLATIPGVE